MCVGGDQQPFGVHPARLESLELGEQHPGVDHHTVADDVGDTGGQDPRRDQVKREVLPRRQHHRVTGVVTPLVANDPLDATTEKVSGFTFALVTPLGADEDDCRHAVSWVSRILPRVLPHTVRCR